MQNSESQGCPEAHFSHILSGMIVNLPPELEAQIAGMAARAETTPEEMLAQVLATCANGEPLAFGVDKAKPASIRSEPAIVPEVDGRGKKLPARHMAGGIITPQ